MALVVGALWLGSLFSGWLSFAWWLLAPPIVLAGYVIVGMARHATALRQNGIDPTDYYERMMPESWRVVIVGLAQNALIFLVGFGFAKLIAH